MSARRLKQAKKGKGCGFWLLIGAGIVIVLAVIGSMLPDSDPASGSVTSPQTTNSSADREDGSGKTRATFHRVVDGDTVETDEGTVRLIGIDAPERGECGYGEARDLVSSMLRSGDTVLLHLPDGQNDIDRHDRLLRYVIVDGVKDLGLLQVEEGHAVARYDSTDGYPSHPKEDAYREAQTATLLSDGSVQTVACVSQATTEVDERPVAVAPAPAPSQPGSALPAAPAPAEQPWYQSYPSCAALKRNTVGHPIGPFDVNNPEQKAVYDWFQYGTSYRGDGDGDGLACE